MRLALRAAHAKFQRHINGPHGRIRSKDHFHVMVEVGGEINIAGWAMRGRMNGAQMCAGLGGAAAGWTKQIPKHIEDAKARAL